MVLLSVGLIHYECNQFITMVQVGYITQFGLYSTYTASGPLALGV